MYARGQAKILAKWALEQYDIWRQDQPITSAFTTVFIPYLTQLRDTLLLYKEKALSFGLRGPAGCTVLRLKAQIDSCLSVVELPTGDSSHGPGTLSTLSYGQKAFTFAFKNIEEHLFHEMGTDTLTLIVLMLTFIRFSHLACWAVNRRPEVCRFSGYYYSELAGREVGNT